MTQGGFGLTVKIEVTSTLTAIAGIKEASFPEQEKIIADVTAHDSASGYREYIATGLRQLNEFELTVFWDINEAGGTHAALLAGFDSDAAVPMSINDPDGDEDLAFDAQIMKVGRVSEMEEAYVCTIAVQPTGAPAIT